MILAVLNYYPIYISQEMVFQSKKSTLQSQASVLASTLSGLESMNEENVARVIEMLDISNLSQAVVTDPAALVLYDSENVNAENQEYALYPEVVLAMGGYDVFCSYFQDGAFHSMVAVPVMFRNSLIGAVYLYEYDADQAGLLMDIQAVFRSISIVVGCVIVIVFVFASRMLTRRIGQLLTAIRIVREGEYSHRMNVRGSDELAELGREFNNLTDRLENTEEMRRRFVSDASHELKTPLASIRLLTDSILQSEQIDADTAREFVCDIGEEAERLTRLTEKLLNLTRLSAVPVGELQPVDFSGVVENVLHTLRPLADQGRITLEFEPDENLVVNGDADDMYQVVFNLVENAIKYNHPGGQVRIRLFRYGNYAELMVEDNGIGIPEQEIPRIFERFYRVDKARSRESGGSGLGLSIVQDTVVKYGGSVTAERSEMGGMCFCVKLPVNRGGEA